MFDLTNFGGRLICLCRGALGCLAAVLATWALACTVGVTGARADPELSALGQGPVEVKAIEGKDTADAYITVLNTGSEGATVSVRFQASSAASIKATLTGSATIQPRQAANVGVRFSGLKGLKSKATGQIVVEGGLKPVAQSATVTPALQPFTDWPLVIILVSLAFSLVLIGYTAVGAWKKKDSDKLRLLWGPAPGPKWSFDSWATHLTAVGALLGTALGAATLPAVPVQIDKESLVGLSLLFVGMAAAGPFVFQAIRSPDAKADEEEEGNWGYTWGLLTACWLTLWAVFGELATLGLAAWVIAGEGLGAGFLVFGLFVLVVLAGYYVVTTAKALATVDWREVAKKAKSAKDAKLARETAAAERESWVPELVNVGGARFERLGVSSDSPELLNLREEVAQESSRASRHLDIGADGQAQHMTLRLP